MPKTKTLSLPLRIFIIGVVTCCVVQTFFLFERARQAADLKQKLATPLVVFSGSQKNLSICENDDVELAIVELKLRVRCADQRKTPITAIGNIKVGHLDLGCGGWCTSLLNVASGSMTLTLSGDISAGSADSFFSFGHSPSSLK